MAEGAPLLREYAVDPASRVRIPPSPPALIAVLTILAGLAAPVGAATPTHPEGTVRQQESTPADRVRIRVIDKVENRRVVMALPLGVTVPLPGRVYSIRATHYTEDFVLAAPPDTGGPDSKVPGGAIRPAEVEGGAAGPAPEQGEDTDPVPRDNREAKNPAVRIVLLREGERVGATWIFQRAPYLFQPSNMRYTFALLGARGLGKAAKRP